MDLNRISVVLRPRTPWEGIDLGFAMARRWFLPLWLLWWMSALPLYLLIVLLFAQWSWLVLLLIWWFKPLYEPPLLFWMSRALFDDRPPLREVARRWFSIVRPQLLGNLTWRRFSTNRSFYMPVGLLERLGGKQRKERIRVLGWRKQTGTWLTVVGLHFEVVLEVSFLILVVILLPEEVRWVDLETLFLAPGSLEEWLGQIADLFAMSLIAPFYVAGGFALYITRRTELEAWDIELSFRRLAARTKSRRDSLAGLAASLAAGLCLMLGLALDRPAQAEGIDRVEARQAIDQVLAHEDFGKTEQVGYWTFTGEPEGDSEDWETLLKLLEGFTKGIAAVGEVLMWLTAGLLVAYLVYWLASNRGWLAYSRTWGRRRRSSAPAKLFGLEVSPDSLPPDIVGEALRLLAQGRPRAALSLLYRGALARFVHQTDLEIPESATEGECLRLVDASRPEMETGLFRRLTHLWLSLAYGHETPTEREVEQLCRDWQRVYGGAGEQ